MSVRDSQTQTEATSYTCSYYQSGWVNRREVTVGEGAEDSSGGNGQAHFYEFNTDTLAVFHGSCTFRAPKIVV